MGFIENDNIYSFSINLCRREAPQSELALYFMMIAH